MSTPYEEEDRVKHLLTPITILIPVLYRILKKVKHNRWEESGVERANDTLFLLLFLLENEQSKGRKCFSLKSRH